jgi:hypothetical protein
MADLSVKALRQAAANAVGSGNYREALNYALQAQALGSLSRAKKGESEMEWPPNELQSFIANMRSQTSVADAAAARNGGFQRTKFVYARPECD